MGKPPFSVLDSRLRNSESKGIVWFHVRVGGNRKSQAPPQPTASRVGVRQEAVSERSNGTRFRRPKRFRQELLKDCVRICSK